MTNLTVSAIAVALKTRQGALAEYAVVPAISVAKRPSNIDAIKASGLAVVGLTAYQSMFHDARLEPGQTVFINGGSTSVGLFAIQIAKARGIKVVVSASAKNEELVRKMGADEVCCPFIARRYGADDLFSLLIIRRSHYTNTLHPTRPHQNSTP